MGRQPWLNESKRQQKHWILYWLWRNNVDRDTHVCSIPDQLNKESIGLVPTFLPYVHPQWIENTARNKNDTMKHKLGQFPNFRWKLGKIPLEMYICVFNRFQIIYQSHFFAAKWKCRSPKCDKAGLFLDFSRAFLSSSSWLGKSFISTSFMGFYHPIKLLVILQLKKINKTGAA